VGKEYLDIPFEIKSDTIGEDGTFEGYGSMFGGEPDSYGDIVVKGAFKSSLKQGGRNKNGIALLWQHDYKQPIGTWLIIKEDEIGLYVKGKLTRGVTKAEDALLLLRDDAIKGLSIGYEVEDYEIIKDKKTNKNIRYLKRINLWEVSLVTFPALVRAQVTGVKAIENAKTERELETALRDAGLSRKESLIIVNRCKPYLRGIKVQKNMLNNILYLLRDMNKQFENFEADK
jgi:HK97 family phage prohead protease